jgi:DNA repair exonuclease SbcCD nuclease subunit
MKLIKLPDSVVNLSWITDIHISATPPGRRQDDYMQAILDKLQFVKELTYKIQGACLCGGDFFHIKRATSPANSLGLLISCIRMLGSFPQAKIFGSVGNHDLLYDSIASLPQQPLGLLIATGVYHNLVETPIIFTNQDDTIRVQVESFPYADGEVTLKNLLMTGPRPDNVTYRIGIVHAYGTSGNASNLFEERKIGYNELKDLDFDVILWGHDHSRHETEKVGKITHINLGSMARAAFASDEVERPVVATILSFTKSGLNYKEVAIPVKPLEIAFTVADRGVERVAKTDEVTEFFEEMNDAVEGIEGSDPREVLTQLCPNDKPLLDRVIQLCEL